MTLQCSVDALMGLKCTLLYLKACLFVMKSALWMYGIVRSIVSTFGSSCALDVMYP